MFDEREIEQALDFAEKTIRKLLDETQIIKLVAETQWQYYKELQNVGFAKEAAFELVKHFKNPIEPK